MKENQRRISCGGGAMEYGNSRKRSETEVTNSRLSGLPTAILLQIFLRLPVKAVMICKIVCHVWYTIISEPYFIENYSKNPHFSSFLLPKYDRVFAPSLWLIEISRSGEFIRTFLKPKSPDFSKVALASSLIGSCNGLLCTFMVSSRIQIYISNPVSRDGDHIALPKCDLDFLNRDRPNSESHSFYMFGVSPNTSNFKVLRIPSITTFQTIRKGQIFTVGADKGWRSLPTPLTLGSRWSGGAALNGISHWILKELGSTSILTFDIEKETFGRISHPSNLLLDLKTTMILALNGKLCLIDYAGSSETCIWTMHEYAEVNSWSKVVLSHAWFPSRVLSRSLVAVALLPNGDIICSLGVDEYVIIYSPELQILLESVNLESGDLDARNFTSRILAHTPILLPLEKAIAGEIVKHCC